ncbi:hypothetical protein PSH03_002463 [Micromonospora sp. PSH03]|uniref:hypothetical protein n=1 Tax=Micromonospora TaxID=1873 RepID=UPI001B370462|nr:MULTISPECIES: hypothetical protein [Micromonospora]MBQ0993377.1 hypothetical protein [Micromonospora sp. H61]MCG5457354.1 hypothetical protein [Micromonospora salmantinae]
MRFCTEEGPVNEAEQFLGPVVIAGVEGIRWVSIRPWQESYNASMDDVQDLDDENRRDLSVFPSLYPDGEDDPGPGRVIGHVEGPAEALELTERATGASTDRWDNHGVAGEDYADFVQARNS